jgi:hypothetical protein
LTANVVGAAFGAAHDNEPSIINFLWWDHRERNMSALYQMRYQGVSGTGHGAVYIGKGKVVGVDLTGAKYLGSYTNQGANLSGTVTLTSAGGALVTGQPTPPGTQVPITFSLPANFGAGQVQTVTVGGQPVQVAFEKVGDIP